ncbi:Thiamine-monophosphate kinase [Paenibacillus solanacearum]|uniref:Thiamine-monophosphate kinase n=1 Tax=Paenibacillus solanacearum TaxID=2048548 RepID=A0A916K7J6_9BACL|nr:thiamine-phosphate kinase [Paenibacillus solanacearum]CAG7651001.1 Thiamine-monophosphate kinase [Paenibacillus solanacearum]
MSSIDEFALIRLLNGGKQSAALAQAAGVVTGIGDDAAVVEASPGSHWILTCDTMTEHIHFKQITMRDRDIGYKAMASAVSDIAAMGGVPRFALVALCMPGGTKVERVQAIYEGLYECASRYGVAVVGGDTTAILGELTLTVTVIGETGLGQAKLRSAAQIGDAVFATGYLGRSAAGLDFLLEQNLSSGQWGDFPEPIAPLVQAHCRPEPQIEAGQLLQRSGSCRALNDVSDGLASELWEIAEASGVGIDVMEERIPVADELAAFAQAQGKDPLDYILYGGEDYQLVGTVPAGDAVELQMRFKAAGLPLHVIGYVNAEGSGVRMVQTNGYIVPLGKKGYNHFSGADGKGGA